MILARAKVRDGLPDWGLKSRNNKSCHSDQSRSDDGGICCRVLHPCTGHPNKWAAI